ncbi:hypothetical protein AV521_32600 [Streptomyces sp. IMTB 2501]|nr:hypothetical protein AV521_32600 [Streptomyces sp. IMTB 2501]
MLRRAGCEAVEVAINLNTVSHSIVGGSVAEAEAATARLKESGGTAARWLNAPGHFRARHMRTVAREYAASLASVPWPGRPHPYTPSARPSRTPRPTCPDH